LIDEAFADFVEGYVSVAQSKLPNVLVLRSMTKFYAMPGIRLGYLIAEESIAQTLRDYLPPWSVGSLSQAVGVAVLKDTDYAVRTRQAIAASREVLHKQLEAFDRFRVFPSAANYLLVRIDQTGLDAQMLADELLKNHRIPIRVCANYAGLDARYFRVAVRSDEENTRLVDALTKVVQTFLSAEGGADNKVVQTFLSAEGGADIPVCRRSADIPFCTTLPPQTRMSAPPCNAPPLRSFEPPVLVPTIQQRRLPHWQAEGAVYWVTFRLIDSIPQDKLHSWKRDREIWMRDNPQPWTESQWREYDEDFGEKLDSWLDAGMGSRALARLDVRTRVMESILRFDGTRLTIHAAVIMPTHVHVLIEPFAKQGEELSRILKGIKGSSACAANRILGVSGSFWLDESYDHIVRSEKQYKHFLKYIEDNPLKANLKKEEYWLYVPVSNTVEEDKQGVAENKVGQTLLSAEGVADIPVCQRNADRNVCATLGSPADRNVRGTLNSADRNVCATLPPQTGMSAPPCNAPRFKRPPVPAIMFQGTSSNAGKSVLTAAFCRILLQDGYRVAPFKSQNMSLNSYVTRDGGEMGRAQVMQAQACRLDPDVRMNPILLKPNSETGSQVILCGKPVGNMDVEAYIRFKPQAFETVQRAYDSLASEVDVMVLEGAGSPGEVNLKRHDIVNMAMAEYAQAPVLIVGDIDRGGVFASFIGTLDVLSEKERARVAGFVVNRFRGRQELLADALTYVMNHTGLPTLGVVPYLRDLGLPEEDSVSFKELASEQAGTHHDKLDFAVIDLPHISNFTDIDALRIEPDVRVRIVRKPELLGNPDVVILPGSKNVIGDLQALKERGLAEAVMKLAQEGRTRIVGLCGGFQMLGKTIEDPTGIESTNRMLSGLGLLPVETVLLPDKTLKAVHARHVKSGLPLRGYEIHHGATVECGGALLACGNEVAVVRDDGEPIGYASADGRIIGTYLHGFFDADAFRRWFIDALREQRGWPALKSVQAVFDVEPALDRLASVVRASLDVKAIYKKMGLLN
jgi:cobyric acid synthase CobQ